MAFQLGNEENEGINEINLIPLIDIMLVLMIIFLVTATVLNPSITLDLPESSATQTAEVENTLQISIDADNQLYNDKDPITEEQLGVLFKEKMAATDANAAPEAQPNIHLRADKLTDYEAVAKVIATASEHGISRIAFVTDSGD